MSDNSIDIVLDISIKKFVEKLDNILNKFPIKEYRIRWGTEVKNGTDKKELISLIRNSNLDWDTSSIDINYFEKFRTPSLTIIIRPKDNLVYLSWFDAFLMVKYVNIALQELDEIVAICKPKAIYHFNDPLSLEEVKANSKPNTIKLSSRLGFNKYNIYTYKIGEKNKIE